MTRLEKFMVMLTVVVLAICGTHLITVDAQRDAYEQGYKDGAQYVREIVGPGNETVMVNQDSNNSGPKVEK